MIHDGYHPWSYGCPQDPVYITSKTTLVLLNIIEKMNKINVIKELNKDMHHISYCNEDDELYNATGKNRVIGLYDPLRYIY